MKYKVKSTIIHGREGEQVYQYEAGSEIELTDEEAEKVKNNVEPVVVKETIREVVKEVIPVKAAKPRKRK